MSAFYGFAAGVGMCVFFAALLWSLAVSKQNRVLKFSRDRLRAIVYRMRDELDYLRDYRNGMEGFSDAAEAEFEAESRRRGEQSSPVPSVPSKAEDIHTYLMDHMRLVQAHVQRLKAMRGNRFVGPLLADLDKDALFDPDTVISTYPEFRKIAEGNDGGDFNVLRFIKWLIHVKTEQGEGGKDIEELRNWLTSAPAWNPPGTKPASP